MKKIKLLIPSQLVATITPTISLVGCDKKASISWDFVRDGPYTYKSGQFSGSVSSYKDATDKYFDQLTTEMVCDEVVNSIYKYEFLDDFNSTFEYYKVDAECTKIDKSNHKISFNLHVNWKDDEGEWDDATEQLNNIPYDLKFAKDENESYWFFRPFGTYPDSYELNDVLKNDHNWSYQAHVVRKHRTDDFFVNWESTEFDNIFMFINSTHMISTYMAKVPDPGK